MELALGGLLRAPAFSGKRKSTLDVLLEWSDYPSVQVHAMQLQQMHAMQLQFERSLSELQAPAAFHGEAKFRRVRSSYLVHGRLPASVAVSDEVLPRLPLDEEFVSSFKTEYNGTGLGRIVTWALGGKVSQQYAEDLLWDALEDALIAVYRRLQLPGRSGLVAIDTEWRPFLIAAVQVRLPRAKLARASEFARKLVEAMEARLHAGASLLIDGATVTCTSSAIHISPHSVRNAAQVIGPDAVAA